MLLKDFRTRFGCGCGGSFKPSTPATSQGINVMSQASQQAQGQRVIATGQGVTLGTSPVRSGVSRPTV